MSEGIVIKMYILLHYWLLGSGLVRDSSVYVYVCVCVEEVGGGVVGHVASF